MGLRAMELTKKEMKEMLAKSRVALGFEPDDVRVNVVAHIESLREWNERRRARIDELHSLLERTRRRMTRLFLSRGAFGG